MGNIIPDIFRKRAGFGLFFLMEKRKKSVEILAVFGSKTLPILAIQKEAFDTLSIGYIYRIGRYS